LPHVTDPSRIRRILERDRPWAAYALGDLSPGFAEHCQWYATEDGSPALLLLFRRFDPPVLFALGPPRGLEDLLREIDAPVVSLHVRTDALAAVRTRFRPAETRAMWRMVVEPAGFRPVAPEDASALGASDIGAVTRL
jgi:hypothetical protein